ncbi:hypothetical protein ACHHYP_03778 [Achlya hypogyna]|uniref:CCDC43 PWI-like domain-containing protein n=1 Tax=Achlya hypogyna TaxID=1202772 RepID=A0A1V9ZPN5_ACHHY|nr:hypothetical protein ACHHYP_03778 [Achlya hypogyna]
MTFDDWLCKRLNDLAIDGEVYGEYVRGIVADQDSDLDERCGMAVDVLRAVVEDDTVLDGLADQLKAKWLEQEDAAAKQVAASLELEKLRIEEKKQAELKLVEENERKEAEKALARQNMTREEILQREKILNEYGAADSSFMDEDGNVIIREAKARGVSEDSGPVNTNKSQAQAHQQNLRDKMKKEHEQKVKRDKELLEADRLRKEKAKRRTQKREKQRGAGFTDLCFKVGIRKPVAVPPQRAMAQPKAKQKATFVLLLRDALATVGIEYLTLEDIRRSKSSVGGGDDFDEAHALLCIPLWRALHDLCMVILADFQVDPLTMAAESQALFDEPDGFDLCVEVARHYLYEWGFLCHEFYSLESPLTLPGPVLLSALVYLFGISNFFSRQAEAILRIQLGNDHVRLPPYPLEPPVDPEDVGRAFTTALARRRPSSAQTPTLESTVHAIHAAYGKLQALLKEFRSLQQAHSKYLERIRQTQLHQLGHGKVLLDDEAIAEAVLTPYCLWLLRNPDELGVHTEALERRLQNYAQEKLFYQWAVAAVVNGLKSFPRAERQEAATGDFAAVVAAASDANEALRARLSLFKSVTAHWKAISGKEKAKFKAKMESATVKMTEELPVIDLLFTPVKPNPFKIAPPPPSPYKVTSEVPKRYLQEEVARLVGLIETKLRVKLV